MEYKNLMHPLTIKGTTIPNRIVFPPVQTNYAAENGEATDRIARFYEKIAQNKVGLGLSAQREFDQRRNALSQSPSISDVQCVEQNNR